MMRDQPSPPTSDHTLSSVEFAPWPSEVEHDDLWLGKLNFDVGAPLVEFAHKSFSLPSTNSSQDHRLEADFVSINKESIIRFVFKNVIAFRVLDENGLLELWEASKMSSRPASTTFKVRGHKWAKESLLAFMAEGSDLRFSYLVATDAQCLEVVCREEPVVTNVGPAIVRSGWME